MKEKYIDPFTNFGFRKIFGEDTSQPLLLDFLNALLSHQEKIIKLSFKNSEKLGQAETKRKDVYDLYCENEKGEKFIIELQKAKYNYFRERTNYFSTFSIGKQAEKGECLPDYAIQSGNNNLKAVYCVGILNFTFNDYESEPERSEVVHTIKLKDQNGKTFYDKLTYIYLEIPNFKLMEAELYTRLDKWLYFIKHLEDFQSIPVIFNDDVFIRAFEKAELAKMGEAELYDYEMNLKIYRDYKNTVDTAFDMGKIEGILESKLKGKLAGKLEMAKVLKESGISTDLIFSTTGVSKDEINEL